MYSKYVLNEDELYTFYVCLFSLNLPFTNVFPKLSAIIIWQSFSAVDNTTIGGAPSLFLICQSSNSLDVKYSTKQYKPEYVLDIFNEIMSLCGHLQVR